MPSQPLTLATAREGAVDERFQAELVRVLDNIRDPNTDRTAKRKVLVEAIITPGEDRDNMTVVWRVSSKLVPTRGLAGFAEIRRQGTGYVAMEPMAEPDRQHTIPGLRGVPDPVPDTPPQTMTALAEEKK